MAGGDMIAVKLLAWPQMVSRSFGFD